MNDLMTADRRERPAEAALEQAVLGAEGPVEAGAPDAGGAHKVVHAGGGEAAAGEDGGSASNDVGLGEGSGASHGI